MSNRSTIQAELKELGSSLENSSPLPVYTVPDGYFEALPASILARVKAGTGESARELEELSPLLAGLSRRMPYAVPEAYFHSNMASLHPLIAEEEDPAVLQLIERKNPYQVPAGYFDSIATEVLNRVRQPRSGIVRMVPRRNWMRIASAAMIIGIISISGIFYFKNRNEVPVDSPQWVSKELKSVSDRELEEFVRITDMNQTVRVPEASAGEVEKLLQDIPDTELQAFLEGMPHEEELAIN